MSGSSSVLNPDIALQAGVGTTQPVNLLAQAADVASLQKNLLAVQQAKQGLQSTLAIGQAAQQAINPDGTVDQGKFRTLVANDPDAAYGAQAAVGTSQDQQEEAYKVNQAALGQSTARAGVFSTALAPLLGQGDSVQPADVYGVVARLHAAGVPTDEAVNQVASTMPQQGGPALRQWITQNATGSGGLPTSDALAKPGFINTGGAETGVDTNPITNPGIASTTLPRTLTPEGAVAPVQGRPDPITGGPTTVPTAAYAAAHGMSNLIPGTGRAPLPAGLVGHGGAPSGSAASAPPSGQGAPQSAFGGGGVWSGSDSDPDASPASYGAPTPVGLGPGQKAGIEAAGTASASQWADL